MSRAVGFALASREESARDGVREVTVRVLGLPVWRSRVERVTEGGGGDDCDRGRPVGYCTQASSPLWCGDGGYGDGMASGR